MDAVHSWRGKQSPLNSDHVFDEVAEILRRYNLREVISDLGLRRAESLPAHRSKLS